MLNKTKARKTFHNHGIQISCDTTKAIEPYASKLIEFAAENAVNRGIKRVTVSNLRDLISLKNIDQIIAFNAVDPQDND